MAKRNCVHLARLSSTQLKKKKNYFFWIKIIFFIIIFFLPVAPATTKSKSQKQTINRLNKCKIEYVIKLPGRRIARGKAYADITFSFYSLWNTNIKHHHLSSLQRVPKRRSIDILQLDHWRLHATTIESNRIESDKILNRSIMLLLYLRRLEDRRATAANLVRHPKYISICVDMKWISNYIRFAWVNDAGWSA